MVLISIAFSLVRLYQDGTLCIRSTESVKQFQDLFFPDATCAALKFEETQWAAGPIIKWFFLTTLPIIQPICRSSYTFEGYKFTIPPATALIQNLFFSRKLSTVLSFLSQPSILWPYSPRNLTDGHPVAAWSHGTSGIAPNCAPSHYKSQMAILLRSVPARTSTLFCGRNGLCRPQSGKGCVRTAGCSRVSGQLQSRAWCILHCTGSSDIVPPPSSQNTSLSLGILREAVLEAGHRTYSGVLGCCCSVSSDQDNSWASANPQCSQSRDAPRNSIRISKFQH